MTIIKYQKLNEMVSRYERSGFSDEGRAVSLTIFSELKSVDSWEYCLEKLENYSKMSVYEFYYALLGAIKFNENISHIDTIFYKLNFLKNMLSQNKVDIELDRELIINKYIDKLEIKINSEVSNKEIKSLFCFSWKVFPTFKKPEGQNSQDKSTNNNNRV